MRLAFLCTSSLEDPSPRGRWLPLARELAAQGHQPELIMLHPTFDRLPRDRRRQERGGVVVYYAGQMHVYGPVTRRRYYGSAALLRVTLLATRRLLLAALRSRADAIHVCKPQPMNGLAGLLAARRLGVALLGRSAAAPRRRRHGQHALLAGSLRRAGRAARSDRVCA